MRVFFLSKKGAALGMIYVFVFFVLAAGPWLSEEDTAVSVSAADDIPSPWYSGDPEREYVSLAVNVDWGEEYIPDMLRIFAENDVSATFFLSGRWCGNNPQLAREISLLGHELGNHGFSHASPNASTRQQVIDEILSSQQVIAQTTGVRTRLYAPPSGEREDHVLDAAHSLGYDTVLWSVDTIDWQKPDAAVIIGRVEEKIHGGAIVLCHPTASTVEALPVIIAELKEEGYEFVTVSENLGI